MDRSGYVIAEFNDGLQIIPALWYNAEKQISIWPNHFKTQLRINKAIITREMPQEISDWEQLPIKRIFGTAGTYAKAMEKLTLAQDTSNIDDTEMSSEELREREKKRRRMKAKKRVSSSSDEDFTDKENNLIKTQSKTLPAFPTIEQFVPVGNRQIDKQSILHKDMCSSKNILPDKILINIANKSEDANKQITLSNKGLAESSTINIDKENVSVDEFKKQVILKLNKIIYKLDTFENKINMLEHKIEFSNSVTNEYNITFPLLTMAELIYFEEQLQEVGFKNEVLNIFKLVGGGTAHVMTHNILKKAITNSVALNFSWAGKRNKKSFKDLNLAKIIAQAVRMLHSQVTDNDIADSVSKWLAQATLRFQRQKSDQTI